MKKVVLATVALSIGICGSPAQAVDSGDLSSSERTLNAGAAGTFGTATLNAKTDHERTVSATDFVTPAELVALSQVLNTQAQSIILDGAGRAVGGTAMLHTDFAAGHPTALTIPQGVVLVHDQSIAGNLSITGNLINAGAIYSVASSLSNTSATIQANSIFNAQTGVISSVLPSILAGNYASSVNLNLVSVGDVTNLGAITSSGALSITAGGAVQNLATGTILANASANIMSLAGNIVNSGSILAQAGNIALSSLSTQNLLINNTLGSITALTGAVNIGTEGCIEKINTAILGGDIVARQLNVHSGDGSVVLNLNRTTATVNITAGEAHVFTAAGDLSLGLLNLSGDPTFYNQGGDILINTDLVFPGQPLAVVAARDIRTSTGAGRISTASFGGGGDIVFIAGAAFEADGPSVTSNPFAPVELRITGPSATGGIINLAGATPITEFDSSSSGGAGGNINLIAFRGALAGGGSITTPANVTIKSGGAPGKSNGDVTLLASAYPTAISIGSIDTSGGNSGGNVVLAACSFINYNHPVVKDSRLAPGTIYIYEDPFGGYSFSGSIYAASIGTGGGNISLLAGEDMHVNSVNLNGTSTRSPGTLKASLGYSYKNSTFGTASATGIDSIAAAGSNPGGNGGIVNLFAKTGNISLYSSGLNVTSAGNGASVTLEAESGDTTVYGDLSVSGGGSNGSGGLISMIAGNSTQFAGTNWLSASGAGTGNGGTLKIQNQTGFDTGKLGVTFIATGGAPGSSAGNGGTLQVETSGNIVFDPATTNVSALGNNGNGGTISLSSNGNLLVTSPVSLDGNGSGSGGTINFQASANALVQGDLSASSAGGKGGSITVSSQFAGAPFKVDSSATVGIQGKVSATGATAGGSIALKSLFSGLQLLRWTDLDVSGGTNGGTIRLNNSFGNLTVPTGVVSVSGTGASGKGGNIEIHSFSNLILTGAGVLQLEANGSGTGDGGSIKVGGLQSVTKLGNGTGEFIISATGGSIGSTSGNGGSIDVSGNPVSLVSAFYDVSPRGLNGNGGTVKLTGSSINSDAPINVDGKGIGDGGYAYVQSNTNFSVGPGITTSGVSSISARAGAAGGSGGKIELRGSITVNSPSDLRIDATDGHGGFLLLQGLALTVLNAGTFNANGAGTGAVDHSGGTVYIYAQNSLTMSGVSISANAGINGYGGGVSVYSTNSTFSIGGPGANLSLIEALGGTTSGDGGNIGLGFANLTADGGSLRTGPLSANGAGGTLTIQTTQAPTITGDIDLRGNGTGSGGRFNILNTNGLFQIGSGASTGINGNILLSGGGNGGSGGWLSVQKGNGTMEILDTTAVDVSGTGNGGRIDYMGDTLKLPAGTFSVNGNGAAGNGGYFFAQLRNLITPAAGNLTISANGSGTGNGGGIDINILSANPLTLGPNVFLSATGGSAGSASGDGGLIRVVSGITGISLIGDNITTQPLGANGKGGYLIFTGYPLSITGSLSANGVGSGAGGRIQIYSGSTFTVGALGVSGNGVTGDISAFSSGTGPGGTVDISAPTITVLSSINVGKTGTIFTNGGLNSVFQGTGQVTGNLYLYGFNTTLNLSTPVTVLGIIAAGGTATINVPSLTVIPAGSIQGNNITIDSPVVHNNGNIRSNSSSTIQIRSASDLLVDGFGTIFGNVNFVSNTGNISVTQGNIYGTITHLAPGNFSLTIGQTLSTSGVLTSTFFDGNTVRTISSVAFVDTRLPNAPSSSIAATDTTRFTLSLRKEGSDKMDGNVKYVLSMRTDLVMLTRANQIFGIAGGDDSYAEGEEGTIVSEENDVTVIHCGKVVIDTGDKAVNIKTPEGTLSINPNSTVLVERSRTSRTRVVSLGGTGGTMNLKADNSAVNLSLGQELIASETELPDEELIPADGIPRESALEGAIHKEKTRRIVSNLKVKHVLERDVMIAGCLVHVGGSHANKASTARLQPRLASHLQAAAFTQGDTLDAARLRSVAGVSKVGESLPARIHVEKDTDLQRKDGAIELNQGSVVFCTKDGQTIKTPNVTLQAKSNTAMQVERRSSATIVRVCSGVNTVKAVVGKKHLFLSAGDELIVSTTDVRHEKDGIGRREFRHLRTEGASIRLAEFSLIGVLGTGAFNSVAHGSNDSDKFALNQILKSAASLQMVRRSRTPFES